MPIKNPTNTDLLKVLDLHYNEYIERFTVIENQVKKTNGRVTVLEGRNAVVDGIEAYRIAQAVKPASQAWYDNTKLVGAIVFLITAVATVVSLQVGR
ncbi:hypothetical protein H0W80_02820 [Candidatus Saccharibacteria bacterium]|nr:hypothetical protein [Candidatus Saccharibacteria bacterium]